MNRYPSPARRMAAVATAVAADPRLARATADPIMEILEGRQFLTVSTPVVAANTATLRNGTLLVQGSDKADQIVISLRQAASEGEQQPILVKINGKDAGTFSADEVNVIRAYGLGGSDRITVDDVNGAVGVATYMLGGNGNDRLTGGGEHDTLVGGKGDDLIVAGGAEDYIDAGAGNDRVLAGSGRDTVSGGPGHDTINTGAGKDVVLDKSSGDVVDTGEAASIAPDKKKVRFGGVPIIRKRRNPAIRANAFNGTVTGLTPQQIRTAYEFGDLSDKAFTNRGQGQTIAIIVAGHYPTALNDVNVFSKTFGLKKMNEDTFQYVFATGDRPAVDRGFAAEAALDIQWTHAIAPSAKIVLVEADSTLVTDINRAIGKAIDVLQPTGGVINMSLGGSESVIDATPGFYAYFENAKTANITFVAASGDNGGIVSSPAVNPEVLSVGGTLLTVDAQGHRVDEAAWTGGGGGTSAIFDVPEYQKNLLVENSPIGDKRVVPDVSYNADPASGVAVYSTTNDPNGNTGWNQVGGTSAGSPQWSGLIALANQLRADNFLKPIGNGNINNYIYGIARKFTSQVFNDVTTGDNTLHPATAGFDQATGWGTPRATNLIAKLAVADSDPPVAQRSKIKFRWRANFKKDLLTGLNDNAVSNFIGFGTARVRPDSVDLVFAQDPVIDQATGQPALTNVIDPATGLFIPLQPSDQIDISATNLDRIGNTIEGRGSANIILFDGYAANIALQFRGRLHRVNGQDKIIGSFYAISHQGRRLDVGGDPVLSAEFVVKGGAF